MEKTFLITTGGSGGHVIPAIILSEHLSKDMRIIISTDKRGLKYLRNESYVIKIIDTPRLNNIFFLPFNLLIILFLVFKSRFILKKKKIKKIFSTGGYMSLPLILAARILKLEIYLVEPNQVIGRANKYFLNFCKNIFNFGSVEKAAQAKLLSNFLSLLTTTTVIEFFRSAKQLDIDINLLCDVAKLGSGNSGALGRIADKARVGDYKGYVFSVNNTFKDLTYINDLLKDSSNAEELSRLAMNFYHSAKDKGFGDLLVSELIEKEY